jgi:hypothetical protein
VQDRVLCETIEREHFASYCMTAHMGRVFACLLRGGTAAAFNRLEEELALAVFGTIFDPTEIERRLDKLRREALARREAAERDLRLLQRVASYSEKEENTEQQQRAADFERRAAAVRQRTPRRGVNAPWRKDE